jgi:hypothetical protein
MNFTELGNNIFYIENAFSQAKEFIDNIEKFDNDPLTHSVIPKWSEWRDGRPINPKNNGLHWDFELDSFSKGKQKLFDWDRTASDQNRFWPRPEYVFDDKAHKMVESTINMIHNPYKEILKIWSEKTGNDYLEYVSKNYFLRKYHVGGDIGPHIDKNEKNPLNTMDWSVLLYLNDDYLGGEIEFPDLDVKIKPTAGSALIFPCTAVHIAKKVEMGEKYYIFMVIHSEFGYSNALTEPYHRMNELILKHKGIVDHKILNLS